FGPRRPAGGVLPLRDGRPRPGHRVAGRGLDPGRGPRRHRVGRLVTRIGIVGCGPRGLVALERLVAATGGTARPWSVTCLDPAEVFGLGVHAPDAVAPTDMLNTVAGQLTGYS